MNVPATTPHIGFRRCLPFHHPLRINRPIRRLLRLPRNVAIRIGPDVIDLNRERQIGRVLNRGRGDACDRFTPSRDCGLPCVDVPVDVDCDETVREGDFRSEIARLRNAIADLQRELHHAVERLASGGCGRAESLGSPARRLFDEPVAYAYHWSSNVPCVAAPPSVVYVPGMVRAQVSPMGRLIDVVM